MTELKDNSFFKKESVNNISHNQNKDASIKDKKLDRNEILDYIREHAPISKYKLSKDLMIAYTTIHYIVRDLEFAGLITTRTIIGQNNRAVVQLLIPDKNEQGKKIKKEIEK